MSGKAELANHHRLGSRWASSLWMGFPPDACCGLSLSCFGACDSWLSKASAWSSTWSPLSAIILAAGVAVRARRALLCRHELGVLVQIKGLITEGKGDSITLS